eukprot:14026037-Heterocapsa_arctica.AAC.1
MVADMNAHHIFATKLAAQRETLEVVENAANRRRRVKHTFASSSSATAAGSFVTTTAMLKHEGRARALHQLSTAASKNANDRAPDVHDLKPG